MTWVPLLILSLVQGGVAVFAADIAVHARFLLALPLLLAADAATAPRLDAIVRHFLDAGFVEESTETLAAVIQDYVNKGDQKSIDMTYWYARALEQKGDTAAAIKAYSQVAQWNFNYKDVQTRIKRLRAAVT